MLRKNYAVADGVCTICVLLSVFGLNLLLQNQYQTQTMTPMIFVLGVQPGENRYVVNELGVDYRMLDEQD